MKTSSILLLLAGAAIVYAVAKKSAGARPATDATTGDDKFSAFLPKLTNQIRQDPSSAGFSYGYDGRTVGVNDPNRTVRSDWLAATMNEFHEARREAQRTFEFYRAKVGRGTNLTNLFNEYKRHHARMTAACAKLKEAGILVDCTVGV